MTYVPYSSKIGNVDKEHQIYQIKILESEVIIVNKMMTKEITKTTVKLAKLTVENGQPKMHHLPNEILLGNVKQETAQKLLNKKYDQHIHILEIFAETTVYELPVEEFLKVAKVREPKEETAE